MIVSRHARKRIKNRIHKNWRKIVEELPIYGIAHNELRGSLKQHIDHLAFNQYRHESNVTSYIVHGGHVFLFNDSMMITVIHLPAKHAKLAQRLTRERREAHVKEM